MHRRKVLKYLAGAAAACPTCLSVASALASEKKAAAGGHGVKGAEGPPHWEYKGEAGPENWGELSPGFRVCDLGFQQSPIDLDSAIVADVGGIAIDYRTMPRGPTKGRHQGLTGMGQLETFPAFSGMSGAGKTGRNRHENGHQFVTAAYTLTDNLRTKIMDIRALKHVNSI
jgi:hypothetical protein